MRKWLLGVAVLLLGGAAVAFLLLRPPRLAPGVLLSFDGEGLRDRMGLASLTTPRLRVEAFKEGRRSATSIALQPVAPSRVGTVRLPLGLPKPPPKWVRVSAWVKAPADSEVNLELEAAGEVARSPAGPTGDDWHEVSVTAAVPDGAQGVRVGMRLVSQAQVLVDDVKVEVADGPGAAASPTGVVRGQVVNPQGQGTPARVQLVDPSLEVPAAVAATDADGRFEVEAAPGHYGLVAIANGVTLGFVEWVTVAPTPADAVTVVVGAPGFDVAGRVLRADREPLRDTWVGVAGNSDRETDLFLVRSDAAGAFSLRVPLGSYRTLVAGRGLDHVSVDLDAADAGALELLVGGEAIAPPPPSAEVVQALREATTPLRGTTLEGGEEDLAPLGAWVGDARVVGVGEATHGTHEFAALRLRLLAYLVRERGFTALALEGNGPEVAALDDYVQGGPGPVEPLLHGLLYWMWATEEFRATIEWLREWNAHHAQRVAVVGVDMQYGARAAKDLDTFLARVEPTGHGALRAALATVDDQWVPFTAETLKRAEVLANALQVLEANRAAWEARTSAATLRRVELSRRTLAQYAGLMRSKDAAAFLERRDRFLGENLLELTRPAEARVVFWAHNGHVSRARAGKGLVEAGVSYRALGFLFGRGQFLAKRMGAPAEGPEVIDVGPPPGHTLEATLAQASAAPLYFFPAALPEPARRLVATPQRVRIAGGGFYDESSMLITFVPEQHFDGFISVAQMTAMVPLPKR